MKQKTNPSKTTNGFCTILWNECEWNPIGYHINEAVLGGIEKVEIVLVLSSVSGSTIAINWSYLNVHLVYLCGGRRKPDFVTKFDLRMFVDTLVFKLLCRLFILNS